MIREGTSLTPIPRIRRVFYTTFALLPVTGVEEGDLGYATDTTLLYRWSGAAWQPITSLAIQTFAALTDTRLVRKTADQIVNNSIVLVNDLHLIIPVGVNEIWQILLLARCTTTAAADIKHAWTIPVGATIRRQTSGDGSPCADVDGTAPASDLGVMTSELLIYRLIYIGGVNAGNVQWQWAQGVAEATDTTIFENSCIIAHQLA